MTERVRDVLTVGKAKVMSNDYYRELNMFETERFFKDKKLRIVDVLGTKPLKISVKIEEDNTDYSEFKEGGKPNNVGKIIIIGLEGKASVEAGSIMQSGDAYVTFDYPTAVVNIFREAEMRISTRGIVLTSATQSNLNELYTTEH